jgi:ATP-dependent helicase/nuclease subunit A
MNAPVPARFKSPEQHAAGDPQKNVWVAASAGSGKTSVLVDRLLRLLLDGAEPHRLLCLTFTKAAAAEMSKRLSGELGKWVLLDDRSLLATLQALIDGPVEADRLDFARQLFARVLETPGGLRIQTIHGFCESLLARFPVEAGQAPNFDVLDERDALSLLASARDAVLIGAAKDEDLSDSLTEVSARAGEIVFEKVIGALVSNRGRIDRLIRRRGGIAPLVDDVYRLVGVGRDETEEDLIADAVTRGFNEPGLRAMATVMLRGSKNDVKYGSAIEHWLRGTTEQRIEGFDAYCAAFLTKEGGQRKKTPTKTSLERMPDAQDIYDMEAARLQKVIERRKAVSVAQGTAALFEIGDAILSFYEQAKRTRNALDYDDLILRARTLLTQSNIAAWVLFKLDGGIDHILVDEAQDTSPEQWDVVFALAEEFFAGEGARDTMRTVFVVGDEKQSIYSFQGADPRAFEDMRHRFRDRAAGAGTPWQQVPLLTSYRSVPVVLDFVDRVFAQPAAHEGVTFESTWDPHRAHRQGHAGLIEIWPTITAADPDKQAWDPPVRQMLGSSAEARLAMRIARTLKRWLDDKEILTARERPVRPEDIMILVRRRGLFFEEMVLALKKEGVPVAGADRMIMTKQLVVEDLMALGRFVLLPEDDLTLAAVLKGPLCGLDDAQLFDLAHGRNSERLWRVLQRRHAENAAFTAAHAFLANLLARVDYVAPYDLYASILGSGGRARLLSRLGREAEDPLDEFMSRALAFERDHPPSLEGFLRWIEVDQAEVKRDLEQARNQVRVMTVHGAKGLQAPIVILPDTCTLPMEEDSFFWTDDTDDALLLWPGRKDNDDAVTRDARERTRHDRAREYRRLLYVAMTRAEDRLYVCGWETRNKRPAGSWYDLMLAATDGWGSNVDVDFSDGLGPQPVWRAVGEQTVPVERTRAQQQLPFKAPAPPSWIDRPAPDEPFPPRPLSPSRPSAEEPPTRSPRQDDRGRFRRGNAIHRLLQFLPDVASDRRRAVAARFVAQPGHDFDEDQQRAIVDETLAVLDDPAFGGVFAPGGLAEAPLAGILGNSVISGQVDRLAITDDEVLIVDFKTNRDAPAALRDVPEAYVRQLALYRAVLAQIYPGRIVRCALLWTDGPRLMPIPDALLDKALS